MLIRRSAGFKAQPRNHTPQGEPDIRTAKRALREVGMSRSQAKTLLSKGFDAAAALNDRNPGQRDAVSGNHSQPPQLRDAVAPGRQDIVEKLMIKINLLLKGET